MVWEAKCFRATNQSFISVCFAGNMLCAKASRTGDFVVLNEGMQEYSAPYCCPGCGTQRRVLKAVGLTGGALSWPKVLNKHQLCFHQKDFTEKSSVGPLLFI